MMASRRTVGVMADNQRLKLGIKIVGGSAVVVTFSLALALFIVLHHHNHPKPSPKLPIFQLMSFNASPLSKSSSATWNLTITLTNSNSKHLTLSIETLTFANFYYPNNSSNVNASRVLIGDVDQLGPILVQAGKQFLLPLYFSTHSVGSADQMMIIRDQASGRVEAGLTGSVRFRFGKEKKARFMGLSCIGGLYIGYQIQGNGVVSKLPRNIEISDFDFDN